MMHVLFTSFVSSSALPRLYQRQARRKRCQLHGRGAVRSCLLPHVVVLPGLDGSSLLLDKFLSSLRREPGRVVRALEYPSDRYLDYDELESYVRDALKDDEDDGRGHVLVGQSYSAHVVLRVPTRARVLVNGFVSAPWGLPPYAWRIVPEGIWSTPPSPALTALAAPVFLGTEASATHERNDMVIVHRAGASVRPEVMTSRLRASLHEDAWHLWRDRDAVPGDSTMYLAGGSDRIVGNTPHAEKMRRARTDITWNIVPNAPHLLLQTHGSQCAKLVDDFL